MRAAVMTSAVVIERLSPLILPAPTGSTVPIGSRHPLAAACGHATETH